MRRKNIINLVAWGLLLAAVAAVYICVVEEKFSRYGNFYNADALYIPALCRDLASGVGISGWNPSAVPYFFPDIALFFLISVLAGNLHLAIVLFGVVQFLALIAGFILVGDAAFGRRPSIRLMTIIAGVAVGLLFATGASSALLPMFLSGFHFGALLSSVYSLALVLRLLRAGSGSSAGTPALYGVLFLVSLLTIASDALYIIQFLVPALAALWLLRWASRISFRRLFYFYVALIPSAPLGYWLNRLVLIYRPRHSPESMTAATIAANVVKAKQGLIAGWNREYWFPKAWIFPLAILGLCFVVLVTVAVLARLRRAGGRNCGMIPSPGGKWTMILLTIGLGGTILPILVLDHRWFFWGTFLLTSACLWKASRKRAAEPAEDGRVLFVLSFFLLILAATMGSVLVSGAAQSRYFLPVFVIPPFFGWPILLASWPRFMKAWDRPGGQIGALGILATLLVVFGGWSQAGRLSELADFYPEQVKCLDDYAGRQNLHSGIAQYWLARPITMLSKRNLLVVQAKADLFPDHWINNLNAYDNRFDFILADTAMGGPRAIKASRVRDRFGEPADSARCGEFEVLAYNRPEDEAFQRQFLKLFNFSFDAAQLASEAGRTAGAASGVGDCLAKTPPLDLWIGTYRFEIAYSAPSAGGSSAGTWDVVWHPSENEAVRLLKKGVLRSDGNGVVSGSFPVRGSGRIEIRVFDGSRGNLRIDALRLKRIR
jgi:hypothetical protein